MNINRISFKADSSHKKQADEYKDPLLKWPLRGAAFTNEVGEGLRPLIGSAATLFWAPVFLYIGADVYDKYKNDKDVYSPDSRRMLKQACFQGFASVILPLAVIKAGQATFSLFGLSSKEKLTYNVQDKINELECLKKELLDFSDCIKREQVQANEIEDDFEDCRKR